MVQPPRSKGSCYVHPVRLHCSRNRSRRCIRRKGKRQQAALDPTQENFVYARAGRQERSGRHGSRRRTGRHPTRPRRGRGVPRQDRGGGLRPAP